MAEISLRTYLQDIDNMIKGERYQEAVAHSTHILETFPKNAAAYRLLGRALLRVGRLDEAAELFRRLLAALPSDFIAHYQLSLVYEQSGDMPRAVWHLERAYDQQYNNEQVTGALFTCE